MHILQAVNLVSILVSTEDRSPNQVNIELENSTYLRITHNYFSRYFMFKKPVIWPGILRVSKLGMIEVCLLKEKTEHWSGNAAIKVFHEGLKRVPMPDYYQTKVDSVKDLGGAKILDLVMHDKKVYSHVLPGKFIQVKQTLEDGTERRVHFAAVPELPMESLFSPNVKPGKWISSNYPTKLFIPKRGDTLNTWLNNRTIGDFVIMGNPVGNFHVDLMEGARHIKIATYGIGLAPVVSILLWILQTTSAATIHLGAFFRNSGEVFWVDELKNMTFLTPRLYVSYMVGKPSRIWYNRRNSSSNTKFRRIFAVESLKPEHNFFIISGSRKFTNNIHNFINVTYRLPKSRRYVFEEMIELHDREIRKLSDTTKEYLENSYANTDHIHEFDYDFKDPNNREVTNEVE
ncbi:cytochrome b5 reductase 4-like [Lycorma delicatula]|uniref:cytochrome b5 reductase 4-like n=1 Tax=Lycorma delicatula TaxID=130591 RepID=UPI003F510BA1